MFSRQFFIDKNLSILPSEFEHRALQLFHFQKQNTPVYLQYLQALGKQDLNPKSITEIIPLPIGFFKTHSVVSFQQHPEIIFNSSGTTGLQTSRHLVPSIDWYNQVCTQCFTQAYGHPSQYVILGLLPAYLERSGSSLIHMCHHLMKLSNHKANGFYLRADEGLLSSIQWAKQEHKPVLLIGVTFALYDLAERQQGLRLPPGSIVMETGGMKGRKVEPIREELHQILQAAFDQTAIHSEFGMTELMSQCYARSLGVYHPPPWFKVLVRSEENPFELRDQGRGLLVFLDLANIDSCAFIESQDLGELHHDGSFTVLGRLDASDLRGCSLLSL